MSVCYVTVQGVEQNYNRVGEPSFLVNKFLDN